MGWYSKTLLSHFYPFPAKGFFVNIPQDINTKFNLLLAKRNIHKMNIITLENSDHYYFGLCKEFRFDKSKKRESSTFYKRNDKKTSIF